MQRNKNLLLDLNIKQNQETRKTNQFLKFALGVRSTEQIHPQDNGTVIYSKDKGKFFVHKVKSRDISNNDRSSRNLPQQSI